MELLRKIGIALGLVKDKIDPLKFEITYDSDGISVSRKAYPLLPDEDDMKYEHFREVENLAGMAYDKIEWVYRSEDDKYKPEIKDLVDIAFDLKYNGYVAMPFAILTIIGINTIQYIPF